MEIHTLPVDRHDRQLLSDLRNSLLDWEIVCDETQLEFDDAARRLAHARAQRAAVAYRLAGLLAKYTA